MLFKIPKRLTLSLIPLTILITGCLKVGPNYAPVAPCTPDQWHEKVVQSQPIVQEWWKLLNDPYLTSLINRAEGGNLTLKEAYARVDEARALRGIAVGGWFPNINTFGSAEKKETSMGFPPQTLEGKFKYNRFSVNALDASWEIDLWGKVSRLVESADANWQATLEDYRDVLVILNSEIASTYIEVRTLQNRIANAGKNVKSQENSLVITQARFNAELTSELDVFQAELNLRRTESTIPQFEARLTQAINRLGVLLGEFPSALHRELHLIQSIPEASKNIAVGLPCDLLRQRPDVRAAERSFASQYALIGAATAELYPQFSLTGMIGYLGERDIFDSMKRFFSYAGNYFWNLFDGGQNLSQIDVERARAFQAKYFYEQTVLSALEEAESAMNSYVKEGERRKILEKSVIAAQKSVDLVNYQYKNGLVSFDVVLDMQRALFDQEDLHVESQGLLLQNLIRIYKSLGGGWCQECSEQG